MIDIKTHPVHETELAYTLRGFEERYGVPSERMIEPFMVDGDLRETDELRDWQATYAAWRLCQRRNERVAARAS